MQTTKNQKSPLSIRKRGFIIIIKGAKPSEPLKLTIHISNGDSYDNNDVVYFKLYIFH